jgi:hypothetical protein
MGIFLSRTISAKHQPEVEMPEIKQYHPRWCPKCSRVSKSYYDQYCLCPKCDQTEIVRHISRKTQDLSEELEEGITQFNESYHRTVETLQQELLRKQRYCEASKKKLKEMHAERVILLEQISFLQRELDIANIY